MATRKQAIDYVTSGSYKRDLTHVADYDTVQNTEQEWTELATAIVATAKDELFSWIRFTAFVVQGSAAATYDAFEYAVIKCLSTEALQDLNDDAVIELLQKEGKLFTRQYVCQSWTAHPKKISFEFYNVKLKNGEELRLVVRPVVGNGDMIRFSDLEYRQVGA